MNIKNILVVVGVVASSVFAAACGDDVTMMMPGNDSGGFVGDASMDAGLDTSMVDANVPCVEHRIIIRSLTSQTVDMPSVVRNAANNLELRNNTGNDINIQWILVPLIQYDGGMPTFDGLHDAFVPGTFVFSNVKRYYSPYANLPSGTTATYTTSGWNPQSGVIICY